MCPSLLLRVTSTHLPCTLTVRNHPRRESLKHFPDRIYRRVNGETGRASVNGIVLHVLGILRRSCGWWRWLWTVLLRRIRGTTPKRCDAVGASPIRRLGCVHVGSHAGNTTATASTAGSRSRRALAAVQGRSQPATLTTAHAGSSWRRAPGRWHVNTPWKLQYHVSKCLFSSVFLSFTNRTRCNKTQTVGEERDTCTSQMWYIFFLEE